MAIECWKHDSTKDLKDPTKEDSGAVKEECDTACWKKVKGNEDDEWFYERGCGDVEQDKCDKKEENNMKVKECFCQSKLCNGSEFSSVGSKVLLTVALGFAALFARAS